MSDVSEKGSSSYLAITEKKNNNQKPSGGCIGIFFQLFDWNTNKRLFSKKLLPPSASTKQDSLKKFKGDEKMPNSKLHSVANGNYAIEVEQKHEMKVPSLVARLMGLESIPSSKRDKSKKSSFSDSDDSEESLEIGVANARHDSRPQKLRKMEANERRAVTRFGAEALQIKSVLSQVRKHNHHHHHHANKFVSPLKSPRISSRKSVSRSSRLIEAATKILEPGLQATSRSKCTLTSSISKCPSNSGIVMEKIGTRPEYMHNQSCYSASIDKSLVEHTCKSCGNFLDVEISRPIDSRVFINFSSESAQNGRSFTPSHENDVVIMRSQEKIITLVDEDAKKNGYSCKESTSRRIHVPAKWDLPSQPCGGLEDDDGAYSFAFKHKTRTQERMLSDERMSYESRTSNIQEKRVSSVETASTMNGNKDFVALNRSLSGRTRIRSPTKEDSCKFDLERKHRNVSSNAQGGKRRNFYAFSPNNSNVKCKRGGYRNVDKINDKKINKVVTSTFCSPLKKKINDNEIKTCFQRHHSPSREDALSAFLEQKLKELISRENEELATGDQHKRSPALILQELISVLNAEHHSDDCMFNNKDHQYETNHVGLLKTSCNGNHLSPGSVLEASFSSSSLDESSGHSFHVDSINGLHDRPKQFEHDAKVVDSTTSFNIGMKIGCKILTEFVNQIDKILQSLDSFWIRITESKLNHMKEVIFIAELILGNVTRHSADEVLPQLLISCILVDELDNMVTDAMRRSFNRSQLNGFLFDCAIEFLESNCCQNYYNVFKLWSAWTKVPLCMKGEILVQEVKSEIKKWECIVGMESDQIIEWEMSHSLGKWNDFNVEALEFGVDVEVDLLQILVDEIVEDLLAFCVLI